MSNELYELCKKVYERTGWEGTHDKYRKNGFVVTWGYMSLMKGETPLYTSDYLLERLPKKLPHHNHYDYLTVWADSDTDWNAAYELNDDCENFDFAGDTPLEALLHLVIALGDAGQLKGAK